ncbi:hypothetical protein RORB6_19840 [Raoultella ornithinolytica B6]|nr:hypothetical protein RORB6_19840 [Raoultella ornithinolytica B6]
MQTARPGEPLPVVQAQRLVRAQQLVQAQRLVRAQRLEQAQRLVQAQRLEREQAYGVRPLPAQILLPTYVLQPKGGHVALKRKQGVA